MPASQLATIKPDGSGFKAIVDDGVNNGFPSWSPDPDGKQIVYKRGKHLVIRTLANGQMMPLTNGHTTITFRNGSPTET